MQNRLENKLAQTVPSGWSVHDDVNVVSEDGEPTPSTRFLTSRHENIVIDGRSVLHTNKDDEEVDEHVEENCFVASSTLYEKFRSFSHPFVDTVFYATQSRGEEPITFSVRNVTSRVDYEMTRSIPIRRLQDFKVLLVEIKTTNDEASNLLSSHQRSLRDVTDSNRFLDFYTLQVTTDFSDFDLPSDFQATLKRH
jgi:hypothetical protein